MKKVIFVFCIWRVLTLVVAALSPLIIPVFGGSFPYYNERLISSGLPHFLWSFGNFDGVHYLGIAQNGYFAQFTQAFFPLYPILVRAASLGTAGNLLISALVISNLAFFIAVLLFYKIIEKKHGANTAFWSEIMLLSFPTSFFFGAIYTEGVFFLLIMLFYFFESKGRYIVASLFGAFASFTRLIGVFLSFPLLFNKNRRYLVFVPPIGLLVYMGFLKYRFNNPLYFLTSQAAFGQERDAANVILLPQVFYRYLKIFLTAQGQSLLVPLFEFSVTLLALVLIVIAFKKTEKKWVLFALASVVLPTLTGTLASMPRYVLVAFPMFVVLAMIKNSYIKLLITLFFMFTGIVVLTFFSQGYWVA